VNLTVYDIARDQKRKKEMREKSGKDGLTFMDIEGIYVRGSNEEKIKRAVEKRRTM
jgi:hypothetical protein